MVSLVSVIVVTCAKREYLSRCLESLKGQSYQELEIIVIDNCGDECLKREIECVYPDVKMYSSAKNLFYCQALNHGIKISRGEFLLCLNDDTVLEKKFIEEALKVFFDHSDVGLVSGKILRADGKTIDSTGLFLTYWLSAKERGYGKKDRRQFDKPEYVFGVNGAVAFYRRSALEEIRQDGEYFDPEFHIFYEDLDIAWRLNNRGWKGYYTPRAVAYHLRGGTVRSESGINRPLARRYLNDLLHRDLIKNRYLTIIKNMPFSIFLLHLPGMIAYDLLAWSFVLVLKPGLIPGFFSDPQLFKKAFQKRFSRITN